MLCTDIDLIAAKRTVKTITNSGGKAHAVACDVTKLDQVARMADEAAKLFPQPADLVINNAGIGTGGTPVGEVSMDDWHATMDVNLWGVIHGCHVFAPKLKALGRGGMINVASTASFAAAPMMGPYNVTKAGVLALTETMAAEFAGIGLRITALCPTFVKTNIVANGRISADTLGFASQLIQKTGISAERVAKETLDAYDKKELYVLPQIEARAIWRGKRLMPSLYTNAAGLLQRLKDRTQVAKSATTAGDGQQGEPLKASNKKSA